MDVLVVGSRGLKGVQRAMLPLLGLGSVSDYCGARRPPDPKLQPCFLGLSASWSAVMLPTVPGTCFHYCGACPHGTYTYTLTLPLCHACLYSKWARVVRTLHTTRCPCASAAKVTRLQQGQALPCVGI